MSEKCLVGAELGVDIVAPGRTAVLVNNKPFFPYQNTWALQSMYAARRSSYRDREMIEKSNLTGRKKKLKKKRLISD